MFALVWVDEAEQQYNALRDDAQRIADEPARTGNTKSSRQEGLFKQVQKTIKLLRQNPRHPGLHTHQYSSIRNPYDKKQKVFEAYAQNQTPGAYRVFWCYGPGKNQLTIIAITAHP